MKKLIPLLAGAVLIAGVAVCPPAYGEFVHLSFFSSESTLNLHAYEPGQSWDTAGSVTRDRPLRMDLFYDPGVPATSSDADHGYYLFTDPATAFFRVSTENYLLPPINFTLPIDSILVDASSDRLTFNYWNPAPGAYAEFELNVHFDAPLATGVSLPTPPFPQLASDGEPPASFWVSGGGDLFNLPAPGNGTVWASFTSMQSERVDTIPPFVPVPEPSTYGLMGALALTTLVAVRRRASFLARILLRLRGKGASLTALAWLALGAATSGNASLILYARQGGPMEWTYQGPVAARFTLNEASRILAVKTWVNGYSPEGPPSLVDLSVSALLTDRYDLYSTSYAISQIDDAPAKWQAVTGLKFDLQPGDYWLKFEGGDYPLGYGYYGPSPDAPYPEEFATRWTDSPEWFDTGFPFGLQVYAVPLSAVPEPATYGLVAVLGLSGLAAWRRIRGSFGKPA